MSIFSRKEIVENQEIIKEEEKKSIFPEPEVEGVKTKDGAYEVEVTDVIKLENICRTFKDGFKLFDNFNLTIKDFREQGQLISILAESGAGKSQILKLISRLEKPDSGKIYIYGKPVDEVDPIPMVFQQYSSLPWMTVLENVEWPLKMKGVDKTIREQKAREMIKVVGLEGQEEKWAQYPILSGGQLQRVAIARNLVCDSQILLLDEATGALDIKSKRDIEDAILNIYYSSKLDPTVINVTHDISEAVYLSNRIYILKARPCSIYKIIDIDFGNIRRTQDIRNTDKFGEYVRQIEGIMNEING